MTEHTVVVAELQTDLRPFSRLLWQRGIRHRIHEQAGRQVLSVAGDEEGRKVAALYREFEAGRVSAPVAGVATQSTRRSGSWRRWLQLAPVTLALLLGCVLGGLVIWLDIAPLYQQLTLLPWVSDGLSSLPGGQLSDTLGSGQWWRLWTPIFLHFGAIHLVFNGLWLWEFGRRIEVLQGHRRLLLLVVFVALGSNLTQYLVTGPTLFGGMSGVVCGLVGYCWGWSLVRPGRDFGMPRALYVVFLLMILAMWALGGVLMPFGFPAVADAAHIGGMVLGWLAGLALARWLPPSADGY